MNRGFIGTALLSPFGFPFGLRGVDSTSHSSALVSMLRHELKATHVRPRDEASASGRLLHRIGVGSSAWTRGRSTSAMNTLVVGLTGGIAAGKSTIGTFLRRRDVPVLEADRVVEQLYAPGGAAVGPLRSICPEAVDEDGGVDRTLLAQALRQHPERLKQVEAAVHPLVEQARLDFVEQNRSMGVPMVVVDVPLLYETGGEAYVDAVILAHADRNVREKRAMERPGMTKDKLDMILARQWSDDVKAKRADFVIDTGGDLAHAEAQLDAVLADIRAKRIPPRRDAP